MISAVIFDADDTLWETEPIYDDVLNLLQQEMDNHGLDGQEWRQLQRAIDIDAARSEGYNRKRFPSSSVKAYRHLAEHYDPQLADRLYKLSEQVFDMGAKLVPGAFDTLNILSQRYRLALLTKGDQGVQHKRISDSELIQFFEVVAIVQQKSPSTFSSVCRLLDLNPYVVVSVGNSMTSDIMPAIQAGLHAIWIDAYVWEHEKIEYGDQHTPIVEVESIIDVPRILKLINKD